MLLSLHIKDFGLVEQGEIFFEKGLTVLTGETGAGKSIILEALLMVLGERASLEFIRAGANKSVVSGIFDEVDFLEDRLSLIGVELEEDKSLILSREINKNGKNICRINGQIFPLGQYRNIASFLVEFQGQHEQQTLLDFSSQLNFLDSFGGEKQREKLNEVSLSYQNWQNKRADFLKWEKQLKETEEKVDFYNFQLQEIKEAQIEIGEFAKLETERNKQANMERIKQLALKSYEALTKEQEGLSVVDSLGVSNRFLEQLLEIDNSLANEEEALANCLYQIEDIIRQMANYLNSLEFNPFDLEALEDRLEKLRGIFKKYGATEEKVLEYQQNLENQLSLFSNWEDRQENLAIEVDKAFSDWDKFSEELSLLRRKSARALEKAVLKELKELEMEKITFELKFSRLEEPCEKGKEKIEFYASFNAGEPLRPLAKIASGGELSRMLLAIKKVLAEVEGVGTLIFDEVDSGIGGRALKAVATKLFNLSQKRQLICVTHAASVASKAKAHYYIYKESKDKRTVTRIKRLEGEEIIEELSRMLGGDNLDILKEHARQLLKN